MEIYIIKKKYTNKDTCLLKLFCNIAALLGITPWTLKNKFLQTMYIILYLTFLLIIFLHHSSYTTDNSMAFIFLLTESMMFILHLISLYALIIKKLVWKRFIMSIYSIDKEIGVIQISTVTIIISLIINKFVLDVIMVIVIIYSILIEIESNLLQITFAALTFQKIIFIDVLILHILNIIYKRLEVLNKKLLFLPEKLHINDILTDIEFIIKNSKKIYFIVENFNKYFGNLILARMSIFVLELLGVCQCVINLIYQEEPIDNVVICSIIYVMIDFVSTIVVL